MAFLSHVFRVPIFSLHGVMGEGGYRWNSRAFLKNSKDVASITTGTPKQAMSVVVGSFAVYFVHFM